MRRILGIVILFFFGQAGFSQKADHIEGSGFLKRIEYNIFYNHHNVKNKSVTERILFGETNSYVEFMRIDSPVGTDDITAFRIIKDHQTDTYWLEVMQIPNLTEVYNTTEKYLLTEVSEILIPDRFMKEISLAGRDSIRKHNQEVLLRMYSSDLFRPYRPAPAVYRVGNELAEKLHGKMAALINNFKAEGLPAGITGGDEVTFRCVVGAEVWTLTIHVPQRRALQLSDLCRQIIADACNYEINEAKYIGLLDEIEDLELQTCHKSSCCNIVFVLLFVFSCLSVFVFFFVRKRISSKREDKILS